MIETSGAEAALQRASASYHEANNRRERAMAELQSVIRLCNSSGIPKKRIAEIAQASRQTVYDAINDR